MENDTCICVMCLKEFAATKAKWMGGDPFTLTNDRKGTGESHPYCPECTAKHERIRGKIGTFRLDLTDSQLRRTKTAIRISIHQLGDQLKDANEAQMLRILLEIDELATVVRMIEKEIGI